MQIGEASKDNTQPANTLTMPELVKIVEHCHLPIDGGQCGECAAMKHEDCVCIGVREMSRKFGMKLAELYYFEKMQEGM